MPLFWFCLTIIIGIAAASLIVIPVSILWLIITISFLMGLLEIRYSRTRWHTVISNPIFRLPISFLILGLALGMNQFYRALPINNPRNITHYTNTPSVVVTGIVASDPKISNRYTSLTVDCEHVCINGNLIDVSGKMSISLPSGYHIQYGDRLQLKGNIKNTIPIGSPPTTSRKGQQRVFTEMVFPEIEVVGYNHGNPILASLYYLRKQAHTNLMNLMPFPESAVLSGILLGIDTSIPDYLWNGYRTSGTVHIIVISGFNISIITILLYKMFRRSLRRMWVLPMIFLAIIFYTILTGADQPVIRAAIMALFGLPAHQFGRRAVGIHSLSIAAALMLIINPFLLWDISFQLSFIATLSLLTMVTPINCWISEKITCLINKDKSEKLLPIIDFFVTTICASFSVFPILFKITGTVSTVSLIANLLILPPQPLIMISGGLAVITSLISPLLGSLFAKISWPFLAFCNQVALRSSIHPAAAIPLADWVFWASLAAPGGGLLFFSIKQIAEFSTPHFVEE